MDKMLENVKSIEQDGLLWGASKLIPIGYGIKKLQVCYGISIITIPFFINPCNYVINPIKKLKVTLTKSTTHCCSLTNF